MVLTDTSCQEVSTNNEDIGILKLEIELSFKGIFSTEIEDGDGNFFSNFDDDFASHRLKSTETLTSEELTQFVKQNLKVVWDGSLDNPADFKSYTVKEIVGPSYVSYDVGMNLSDVSVIVDVEITKDDPDDTDFDDLFHAIVFELSDGDMTIMMTEFESYHASVVND